MTLKKDGQFFHWLLHKN